MQKKHVQKKQEKKQQKVHMTAAPTPYIYI